MKRTYLQSKRIVIAQHEADEGGPGKVLLDYFNKKKNTVIYHLAHPNLYIKSGYKKSSRLTIYHNGKIQSTTFAPHFQFPEWTLYLKDVFYTLLWFIRLPKVDLFIGLGNLNAFCGCILKKLGKVSVVIYYVIDYVPQRFSNNIINTIYHRIERIAALKSDWTWNLSTRIIEAREEKWKEKFLHQLVVPHGLYFNEKRVRSFQSIHRHEIIYMGYINEEQGLGLLFSSLPNILNRMPGTTISIIGTGNYEEQLKKEARRLKISKYITFHGLIPDRNLMEERLSEGAIAVALYKPSHGFSFYSDPGKIKHYLSVGLPIIMTGLPPIAQEVQRWKCGYVISYSRTEFIKAASALLLNDSLYKKMRANSLRLAKKYDWEHILSKALSYVEDYYGK